MAGTEIAVHSAIGRALADHGVDVMFGLIGDANLYLIDSYVRNHGGRFVAAANEGGAVLMALGYSQVSDKVGVATVTHGPALTNTLTSLIEGVRTNTPLVLLAGETPSEVRHHLQYAPQRELVSIAGTGFEQVRAPGTILEDIATAFRRAVVERRPIVLSIPSNFQWATIPYVRRVTRLPDNRTVGPSGEALDDAIGIIAAAKRPIVLAGRGVHSPESRVSVSRLARRIEAPLATTLRARGMFHGDPFSIGVFGMMSNAAAQEIIAQSDCIVSFGASLGEFTTYQGGLVRGKRVVQVIGEASALGARHVPDVGLVGDPGLTAEVIVKWLDEAEIPGSGFRSDELASQIASSGPSGTVPRGRDGTANLREVLAAIDAAVPADRVLVMDTGRFMVEGLKHFKVRDSSSFVFTSGYGSIGLGISEGIGAAEAAKGRPVVVVCGDGGFMLGGLAEFNTAVRHRSDLIVLLCNDGSYGAEHIQFTHKNMDPTMSLFDWPDFAPVATALGGQGFTVRSPQDAIAAGQALADRRGPVLIDIKLDPNAMPGLGT